MDKNKALTPSQKAKSAGLSSLAEVSKMTEVSTQTLDNWSKNKPKLFEIVIAGCVAIKNKVEK